MVELIKLAAEHEKAIDLSEDAGFCNPLTKNDFPDHDLLKIWYEAAQQGTCCIGLR